MRKSLIALSLAPLAVLALLPAPSSAGVLDGLHEKVRMGSKTCFSDHSHTGSSSGITKAQAVQAAVRDWSDFTAMEYGREWGAFSLAWAKSIDCQPSWGKWSCHIEAKPCRAG